MIMIINDKNYVIYFKQLIRVVEIVVEIIVEIDGD